MNIVEKSATPEGVVKPRIVQLPTASRPFPYVLVAVLLIGTAVLIILLDLLYKWRTAKPVQEPTVQSTSGGTTTTTNPTGIVTVVAPDGTSTTTRPDGSVTTTTPDGRSTTINKDTSIDITTIDGRHIHHYLDGSIDQVDSKGAKSLLLSAQDATKFLWVGKTFTWTLRYLHGTDFKTLQTYECLVKTSWKGLDAYNDVQVYFELPPISYDISLTSFPYIGLDGVGTQSLRDLLSRPQYKQGVVASATTFAKVAWKLIFYQGMTSSIVGNRPSLFVKTIDNSPLVDTPAGKVTFVLQNAKT